MKKYFPVLIFLMVFFVFLGAQVSFDLVHFKKPSFRGVEYRYYQDIFPKTSFRTIDGKKILLSKVRAPLVILNFWASWCAPCLTELPSLVKLQNKFKNEELLVIGVNTDQEDQLKNILKIKKEYKLNFPIVADSSGEALSLFQVDAIPLTVLYFNGKVFEINQGSKEFDSPEMIKKLEDFLKQSI